MAKTQHAILISAALVLTAGACSTTPDTRTAVAPATDQTWSQPQPLSAPDTYSTTAAFSGSGTTVIIGQHRARHDISQGVDLTSRRFSAGTWQPAQPIAHVEDTASDVDVDTAGDTIVWADDDVYRAHHDDTGWSTPTLITDNGRRVSISGNGHTIVYVQNKKIMVSHRGDTPVWSAPAVVAQATNPHPVISADGATIAWTQGTNQQSGDNTHVAATQLVANKWTEPVSVSAPTDAAGWLTTSADGTRLAWSQQQGKRVPVHVATRTDGDWATPQTISGNYRYSSNNSLSADGNTLLWDTQKGPWTATHHNGEWTAGQPLPAMSPNQSDPTLSADGTTVSATSDTGTNTSIIMSTRDGDTWKPPHTIINGQPDMYGYSINLNANTIIATTVDDDNLGTVWFSHAQLQ